MSNTMSEKERQIQRKRQLLLQRVRAHRTTSANDPTSPAKLDICKAPAQSEHPLSFPQSRLWFLDRLEGPSAAYNIPFVMRLSGRVELGAFRRSMKRILDRHESLRTVFVEKDGIPYQKVLPPFEFELALRDLSHLPYSDAEEEARSIAQQEAAQTFDLTRVPLLRATLIKLLDTSWVLVLNIHHIISDGWSMGILIREFAHFYTGELQGEVRELPPLPLQYVDFTHWQRERLQGEVFVRQLAFWKERLKGAPSLLELPTDRPRPPLQTYNGAEYTSKWSPELTRNLKELSQRHNATLYMTLLSVFSILMGRYGRTRDVTIGSPIANRIHREFESLIGFFVNTLALRVKWEDRESFSELLQRVKQDCLAAYAHQDLPFERLVDELRPQRNLSHTPLFQVMFILQNAPLEKLPLPGMTFEVFKTELRVSKFDLTLSMGEDAGRLICSWEYNTDLFDRETIERLDRNLIELLHALQIAPQTRVGLLALLSSEESLLLDRWNCTRQVYQAELATPYRIEQIAERYPNEIAIEFEGQCWTHGMLRQEAHAIASLLKRLGVVREDRIGLCLERSPSLVSAMQGIWLAGAAYIPLDPSYPDNRIAYMLEDAGVKVLLTEQALCERFKHLSTNVLCIEDIPEVEKANAYIPERYHPEQLAYMIYTSGSTGRPKGVQISHGALINFLLAMSKTPGLSHGEALLSVTTISFDISGLELHLPRIVGAKILLASREMQLDGSSLLETIHKHKPQVMQATPATWKMLLAAGWSSEDSMQMRIFCGGEALDSSLAEQLLDRSQEVWNLYGPTETTIWSAAVRVNKRKNQIHQGAEPIAGPIDNTELYVVDGAINRTPIGVGGELWIGGDGLARGYFNRPGLTAERFVPDPFGKKLGGRLYRTGDLSAYRPSGEIAFYGRIDHQVKLRGFRIELGEIENAIRAHPEVHNAAVTLKVDSTGEPRIVGYIVPIEQNKELTREHLQPFLKSVLPDYMLPSTYVSLTELPLTPNGKVDRKSLPDPVLPHAESAPKVLPRNALEAAIADCWKEVLNLPSVDIHDNFFDLGGHSLLAVKLHVLLRERTQKTFPILELFKHPNIASLAKSLNEQQPSDVRTPTSVARSEQRKSSLQERSAIRARIKRSEH